jgi:hypothetical protein
MMYEGLVGTVQDHNGQVKATRFIMPKPSAKRAKRDQMMTVRFELTPRRTAELDD